MQSILILGAGIGGLSAAHELRKRGFQGSITMLEKEMVIGGQARSSYIHGATNGGGGAPKIPGDPDTQYCWRIVSAFLVFAILTHILIAVWTKLQGVESDPERNSID